MTEKVVHGVGDRRRSWKKATYGRLQELFHGRLTVGRELERIVVRGRITVTCACSSWRVA